MNILVISCSLNSSSRSRLLAEAVRVHLEARADATCEFIDLRDCPLPICDGETAYGDPNVAMLVARIKAADGIIMGMPIYNWYVNAAAKNLVELTSKAWTGKVVAFLCAAGGKSSYMSVMSFANSLMLDFRCLIVPRFVYADGDAFTEDDVSDPGVNDRLREICERVVTLAEATAHLPEPPASVQEEV